MWRNALRSAPSSLRDENLCIGQAGVFANGALVLYNFGSGKNDIVSKHSRVKVTQTKSDDPFEFTVTLTGSGGETHHEVTMTQFTYEKLTGSQVSPENCVHAAFEFLLEREPQESILTSFDITVISTYYPDFETEFSGYLH